MFLARILFAATAVSAMLSPAHGSSSEVFEADGATLRLVTSGLADGNGELRGAIEILLDPGWKTYWMEPGASGVPPQIDVAGSINASSAKIHFPAPEWHVDAYGAWAGYGKPVVLPVTFGIDDPALFSVIEAELFLGICETICIPVQARLTVEPGSEPDNAGDASLVDAAFEALPAQPDDGFGVREAKLAGDMLVVKASVPATGEERNALFLAPERGYVFGVPKGLGRDRGGETFEVPVLSVPGGEPAGVAVSYTLTSGGAAVTGVFTLP